MPPCFCHSDDARPAVDYFVPAVGRIAFGFRSPETQRRRVR